MKTITIILISILFYTGIIFSQTVYKIPFASTGNKIELTVANTSSTSAKFVNVKASEIPSWVKMKEVEIAVGEISPKEEKAFVFEFDIAKSAPVDKEETIKFLI